LSSTPSSGSSPSPPMSPVSHKVSSSFFAASSIFDNPCSGEGLRDILDWNFCHGVDL
jgi:hypothetical protein